MNGLLLHLSGPLQSWGEHSGFTVRDSWRYPTRSALIGLIASGQGRRRGTDFTDLETLRFTIRIDRPGIALRDFHTIAGGLEQQRSIITAEGGRRPHGKTTVTSERWYLTDAAFTIAVTATNHELPTAVTRALTAPTWAPYLGRRSCPPDFPLLIRTDSPDPIAELHRVPLHRNRPAGDIIAIRFVHEQPPDGDRPQRIDELHDQPDTRAGHRVFRLRPTYEYIRDLPANLCAGIGVRWMEQITDYFTGTPV
jgi:CRISPR system Cascade subunit CasD